MLMAHRTVAGIQKATVEGCTAAQSGGASLPAEVARAFRLETEYETSAMSLTALVDEKLKLAQFLASDGSSAAVLVLDEKMVARAWPPCDWETLLLRVRNRLADEGSKFFVALTIPARRECRPHQQRDC